MHHGGLLTVGMKPLQQLAFGAVLLLIGMVCAGPMLAQRLMPVPGGFILDRLTSVTPIAVFSTRKLRGAYAGNAMTVASSGGGSSAIGFDGSGNLNNAALTSFVGANTGTVTTWNDQSGNGNNATVPSGAPFIVASGTRLLLGTQTAVSTFSANPFFHVAGTAPGSITIAMTLKFNTNSNWGSAHMTDGDGSSSRFLVGTSSSQYQIYASGAVGAGGTLDTTTVHTLVATFNLTTHLSDLYVDNVNVISANSIGSGIAWTAANMFASLSGAAVDANYGDFLFLNNIMSGPDIASYHTDCQTYWSSH